MSIQAVAGSDYYGLTSGFPNATPPLTLMYWIKGSDKTGFNYILSLCTASAQIWYGNVIITSGFANFAPVTNSCDTQANVIDGGWHSVAFTWAVSDGNVISYLDGTFKAQAICSTSGTPTNFRVGHTITGGDIIAGTTLYGLKIWNAELTGGEIATENGSYGAVRTTDLYDDWLLSTAAATLTGAHNGKVLTRDGSSFTTAADPPPFGGGAGGFMWLGS